MTTIERQFQLDTRIGSLTPSSSVSSTTLDVSRSRQLIYPGSPPNPTMVSDLEKQPPTNTVDRRLNVTNNEREDKKDPFLVEINGTDDPDHPWNLPQWRKWVAVLIVSGSSACVTCTSSIGSSTYAGIERDLNLSPEVAILSITMFVFGLALGPLLLGPISEFQGRNRVYYGAFGCFFLFNIPVAFANNAPVHFIFRFLSGFVGAAFLSVAGGTVSDLFPNNKLGTPMAVYSTSPFFGPVLGPVIGGFINQNTSWRWSYYMVMIWSFIQFIALVIFAPETHGPTLLRWKAARIRKQTGDDRYYAQSEREEKSFIHSLSKSVLIPFKLNTMEPMAILLNLWVSCLLAVLYLEFNSFPIVFGELHDFSQQESGLSFIGIALGILGASATGPIWKRLYLRDQTAHGGSAPPESRLYSGMLGAILVPISLFLFAGTSVKSVHWIVPIIMSIPFGVGLVLIFTSVFTFLVDAYRPFAASALSANCFMRCALAGGFPLFASQMYDRIGIVGAGCVLGGIMTLLAPLPFVFYKYGARIRATSKFAVN
ncbi:Synaptic vesicle transporter SVOP and related transporters (major facilitator superfamily) [Phaffia rhodozyma]|uniref:Synaptic vesicle transporter SVOP and related transporters (Major facilitator superfamily) n=1 Tax=Phaffia rhodozyma TaxID=264483 RepID=A0A0F7SYZ6_PHARH|nr:Synaptic vesicle transporter SVOP and related transporters (major facilitator superfamily) [Phaffia rhodozyma]